MTGFEAQRLLQTIWQQAGGKGLYFYVLCHQQETLAAVFSAAADRLEAAP